MSLRRRLAAFFGAFVLALADLGSAESSPARWQSLVRWPTNARLHAVCFGAGRFVAAGEHRSLLISDDGLEWRPSCAPVSFDAIASNGRGFVALGEGKAFTSSDGEQWSEYALPGTRRVSALTWGKDRYVAVGETVLVSRDGATWSTGAIDATYCDVAWSGTHFVAVAAGDGGSVLASSRDGYTWQVERRGDDLDLIACSPHVCVAAGSVPTATTWDPSEGRPSGCGSVDRIVVVGCPGRGWRSERVGTGCDLNNVAWAGTRFVGTGFGNEAMTSVDGLNWQVGARMWAHGPLAFGRGGIVGVSEDEGGAILMSEDGRKWRNATPNPPDLLAAAKGAGQIVAVGGWRGIYVSSDGVHWESQLVPWGVDVLERVVFGLGRFVAFKTGVGGMLGADWACVVSSVDGHEWQKAVEIGPLRSVSVGQNAFVAVSERDELWVSNDGVSWRRTFAAPQPLRLASVAWSGRRFLTVGADANLVSEDGEDWRLLPRLTVPGCLYVLGGGNRFVVLGSPCRAASQDSDVLVGTRDGASWSAPFSPGGHVERVYWADGQFVAVLDRNAYTSVDGEDWSGPSALSDAGAGPALIGAASLTRGSALGGRYGMLQLEDGSWVQLGWARLDHTFEAVLPTPDSLLAVEQGRAQESRDGRRWRPVRFGRKDEGGHVSSVAWNGKRTVIACSTGLYTKHDDGRYRRALRAEASRGVYWLVSGGGHFVAGGPLGCVLTSSDGLTWFRVPLPAGDQVSELAYLGGRFLLRTQDSLLASRDGFTWTNLVQGKDSFGNVPPPPRVEDLAWVAGHFVAPREGYVATSVDLANWQRKDVRYHYLESLASVPDRVFGVDREGRILSSRDGLAWQVEHDACPSVQKLWCVEGRCVALTHEGLLTWQHQAAIASP